MNYFQKGRVLDAMAPAGGVISGTAYKLGALFGIAKETVAAGLPFAFERKGAWSNQPKAAGTAWTWGAILYWDDTAKNFTTVATNNTRVGYAVSAQASGDLTGTVLLGIDTI
jgi:predicted RecA/RadA family phage recombinase